MKADTIEIDDLGIGPLLCNFDPADEAPRHGFAVRDLRGPGTMQAGLAVDAGGFTIVLDPTCHAKARWYGEGDGLWRGRLLVACHRHRGMLKPPPGVKRLAR